MNRHGMCNKSKAFLILFLLAISHNVFTQNTIVEYEYWFNDDFNNSTITNVTPVKEFYLSTSISVANLSDGINVLNFRAKDSQGKYSVIASQYFYKIEPTSITNNHIVSYEYWYDDNFQNKISVNISPVEQATILAQLDVSGLSNGMHIFNFRAKDERGYYSSIGYQYFYKIEPTSITNNHIVSYEYWYDDNFQNKISVNISPVEQATILAQLDVSGLSNGMHIFNFRAKDERGYYSSIGYQYFYKIEPTSITNNHIVSYEYWYDDNFQNKISVNISPAEQATILAQLDVSGLSNGMHILNFRVKDERDYYSSIVYQYFYKKKFFTYTDNKIIAYKYWFDNDYNNLTLVNLPVPVDNLHLINLVNMTRVPKGIHTINFQFKDDANIWSVVTTDTIEKISLPIADFSYVVLSSNCDSTVIAFTDNSIDGDVYLWDFADGSTDTSKSPIHVFHNSGIHSVSLTVRDTITLSDSSKQMNILITGKTAHSFAVTSCDSYISPSGNYTYTTSGIYYDTIPNHWGCDSLITIDLNIVPLPNINLGNDTTVCGAGITLNAGSGFTSYQWSTGASTQLITVNSSDTYSVTVTNAQNCSNSDVINITISNISINLEQIGTDLVATIDPVVLGVYTWYTCDNQLVPNITTSNYQNAPVDECFYVIFTDEVNCEWISNEITVVTIDENVLLIASIYPNPATDAVYIDLLNDKLANIYVYDIVGKLVLSKKSDNSKIKLDVSQLSGTYILKIVTDKGQSVFRLIVTK
jgi:PKD repeat protein